MCYPRCLVAGGERLVCQVVKFKKTYSRNVQYVIHILILCVGGQKITFEGNRKEIMCFGGNRREARVNEECVISVSRMG